MLARGSRPEAGVPGPEARPGPAARGQHERALRRPRELRLRVHRLIAAPISYFLSRSAEALSPPDTVNPVTKSGLWRRKLRGWTERRNTLRQLELHELVLMSLHGQRFECSIAGLALCTLLRVKDWPGNCIFGQELSLQSIPANNNVLTWSYE
jgi:hypothetical protein